MRVLAIFCIALSVAIFLAVFLLPKAAVIPICLAAFIFCVPLFFLKGKFLRGIKLALLGFGIGLLIFHAKYYFRMEPCRLLDGQVVKISGIIQDYPEIYDDYCRIEIKLDGENTPHVKALVYDSEREFLFAQPGQRLKCLAKVKSADRRYGKEYHRYNADGIFLIANAKQDIEIRNASFSLVSIEAKIRKSLADKLDKLYPLSISAFLRAATLGDKSGLFGQKELYYALSEAGIMHVAAVSGMHIAFLVGLLQLIFGAGKQGAVFSIIFIWCFVFLTGRSPSAIRAGFMQTLLLLAPVLGRENDSLTSLSAVLALILIINPYAAASISLQLSFGAMAGIMFFSRRIFNIFTAQMSKKRKRRLNYPIAVLSGSLSVTVFTMPLTVLYFGYVPILAPLSNILSLWAVSLSFCGAYISVFISYIIPFLGKLLAFIVSLSVRYIFIVVYFLSSLPFCTVFIKENLTAIWLIASYFSIGLLLLSKLSGRHKLFLSVLTVFALLFSIVGVTRLSYKKDLCDFAVLDVGQGQSIAVSSGDNCVLIDCGGGAKSESAGSIATAYLYSRGKNQLDAIILTHLHSDHTNGVLEVMEKIRVGKLIIPLDVEDSEELLPLLEQSAAKHKTELIRIGHDCAFDFGQVHVELFASQMSGNANERCMMCRVGAYEKEILITGDAPIEAEEMLIETHDLSECEFLIAGHHGSRYSCGDDFLKALGAETAIISVGYNSYGHPSSETLSRLSNNSYNILRTDINGTVEIRIR